MYCLSHIYLASSRTLLLQCLLDVDSLNRVKVALPVCNLKRFRGLLDVRPNMQILVCMYFEFLLGSTSLIESI